MYLKRIIIAILLINSTLFSLTQIDSLKQLVEKSHGIQAIELSIELSKKLVTRAQLSEAIEYAHNTIIASKEIGNKEYEIQALAIIAKAYLLAGDASSAKVYIDSTLNLSKNINYEIGIGLGYQTKGTLFSLSGKFEAGISLLDSSLQIFNYEDNPIELAVSYQTKATVYTFLGNLDSSNHYLQLAMDIFKEKNAFYRYATIKLNKALIQGTTLGQYENAIKTALETLPFFEKAKDTVKISTANSIIANCYDAMGNYDKAIMYYNDAISFMEKSGNQLYLANFYNNLGEVYKHKGDYKVANNYYEKALILFEQLGLEEGIIVAKNNIGECLLYKKKYNEALIYFNESLAGVDKEMDFYKLTILHKNIGTVYLEKGEYNKAITHFNNSIKFGNEMDLLEEVYPVYQKLAEVYKLKGNCGKAYSYMVQYAEGKDEFLSTSNAERLTDIEIKYQTEKKEKEIELLTKNQEIQDLELSIQEYISIVLIVLLIIIGGGSILLLKRYQFKQRTNAILEENNKKMEQYANELEIANNQLKESEENLKKINTTKDKFFSIIAHDLKGPFFSLLGLSEIISEDLDDMTTEEIRKVSIGINVATKKVFALLENLLQWSRAQLGIITVEKEEFDFNELVSENINLFKSNLEQKKIIMKSELIDDSNIYADKEMINFALRNLLNNAIKFTENNGEVTILSKKLDNIFMVSISDTGIGIDKESLEKLFKIESTFSTVGTGEEKGTGLGLVLVKEFIQKNNGEISVVSEVNKGTTFTIKLPLN